MASKKYYVDLDLLQASELKQAKFEQLASDPVAPVEGQEWGNTTDDKRRVEVKGPVIYESNPDGSMKTVLTQEIYQGDELIRQKSFYSNYKSPSLYPLEKNPLE